MKNQIFVSSRAKSRDPILSMSEKQYCVYILNNKWNTVFYVGISSDLPGRVWQHKEKLVDGFTKKYNLNKLLYYEVFDDAYIAITREKQIKKWRHDKKLWLVSKFNPKLTDLFDSL